VEISLEMQKKARDIKFEQQQHQYSSASRPTENSALKDHEGTEDRLVEYVSKNAKQGSPEDVVKKIDEFCWNQHWMMHLGDVKGKIVREHFQKHTPKIVLELGTYCGYSAVMLSPLTSEKFYTIDRYPYPAAKVIVEKAGLQDKIVFLNGKAEDIIPKLNDLKGKVDLVFIDHDKKAYLPDLKLIEQHGLLHNGSVVIADNVLVFHIDAYLEHVKGPNYSSTQTFQSRLEYDDSTDPNLIDGVNVSIWCGSK